MKKASAVREFTVRYDITRSEEPIDNSVALTYFKLFYAKSTCHLHTVWLFYTYNQTFEKICLALN